jgi:hypothetical protein
VQKSSIYGGLQFCKSSRNLQVHLFKLFSHIAKVVKLRKQIKDKLLVNEAYEKQPS